MTLDIPVVMSNRPFKHITNTVCKICNLVPVKTTPSTEQSIPVKLALLNVRSLSNKTFHFRCSCFLHWLRLFGLYFVLCKVGLSAGPGVFVILCSASGFFPHLCQVAIFVKQAAPSWVEQHNRGWVTKDVLSQYNFGSEFVLHFSPSQTRSKVQRSRQSAIFVTFLVKSAHEQSYPKSYR